jgi:hypothetical protein
MSTRKRAALQQASVAITERDAAQAAKQPQRATSRSNKAPDKFTYALKQYTAERRADGWWIARTWSVSAGEKPRWYGPFAGIETACLAVARRLAIEISDRHTHSIEWYGIKRSDPRYGIMSSMRLRKKRENAEGPHE